MAFKDLKEHLQETFADRTYERIVEGLSRARAKKAEQRRERYVFATNGRAKQPPGPRNAMPKEERREKRRLAQKARRDAARGRPKKTEAWKLTPEQRARMLSLPPPVAAVEFGVTLGAVYYHRRKAGLIGRGENQCRVFGCRRKHRARGLCKMHYSAHARAQKSNKPSLFAPGWPDMRTSARWKSLESPESSASKGAKDTKAAWRLTPEQKEWLRTNKLPPTATARLLGVSKNTVLFHRAKALDDARRKSED